MGLDDKLICPDCKGTKKVPRSVKTTYEAIVSGGSRVALENIDCRTCNSQGYIPKPTTSEYLHLK